MPCTAALHHPEASEEIPGAPRLVRVREGRVRLEVRLRLDGQEVGSAATTVDKIARRPLRVRVTGRHFDPCGIMTLPGLTGTAHDAGESCQCSSQSGLIIRDISGKCRFWTQR